MATSVITVTVGVRWRVVFAFLWVIGLKRLALSLCVTTKAG